MIESWICWDERAVWSLAVALDGTVRITVIESWICWDFAFAAALQWGPASPDHGDRELDLLGHRLHVPVRRLPPEPDHGDRELDLLGHGARVGHQDQPAKPSARPERVRDDLRLDAKATLIAWQAKQEQATGRPATLAERHAYLEGLGLEGEKRRAMVAAALELDVADQPEVMDFVQTEAPGLGYDFEAILRAVGAAFPGAVSDETGNVLKIMSAFTGQDVAQVVQRIGAEKPDLNEEMIVEAAKRYHARTGKWPNAKSGDASIDFGFPITWEAVDLALQKGSRQLSISGDSIARLLERKGLKIRRTYKIASTVSEEIVADAGRAYAARIGKAPTAGSGDATEYFGFEVTWAGIDSYCMRTFGMRLWQVLRKHGLTVDGPENFYELALLAQTMFHDAFSVWPKHNSEDASKYFGFAITWAIADQRLRKQYKSSLAQQRFQAGVDVPLKMRVTSPLMIVVAVQCCISASGVRPSAKHGDASQYFNWKCVWASIDSGLREGFNELTGGSTLSKFIKEHFDADNNLRPGIPERYGLTRERLLSLTKDDFNPDGTLKDAGILDLTPSAEPARVPDLTATEKTTGRKTRGKNNPKDDE